MSHDTHSGSHGPHEHGPGKTSDSPNIKHDTDILLLLERGRRLYIYHGDTKWEGVYWGRDDDGEIVAVHADSHWRLVHMELHNYLDCLEAGELLTRAEVRELEQDIIETMGLPEE